MWLFLKRSRLQTLEYLFTPIVAVHQISATVYAFNGAGDLYLKQYNHNKIRSNKTIVWTRKHFRQLRPFFPDNNCDLTIKNDTGQHWQFLRCLLSCFYDLWLLILHCNQSLILLYSHIYYHFVELKPTCSNNFCLQARKAVSLSFSSLTFRIVCNCICLAQIVHIDWFLCVNIYKTDSLEHWVGAALSAWILLFACKMFK